MSTWALHADGRLLSDREAEWAKAAIRKEGPHTEDEYPNGVLWTRHGKNLIKQVDGKWYLCKP